MQLSKAAAKNRRGTGKDGEGRSEESLACARKVVVSRRWVALVLPIIVALLLLLLLHYSQFCHHHHLCCCYKKWVEGHNFKKMKIDKTRIEKIKA